MTSKEICFTVLSIEYFINAIIGLVPLMHPVIKGMVFTSTGPWSDLLSLVHWSASIRPSSVIICDVFDFVRKYLWISTLNWDHLKIILIYRDNLLSVSHQSTCNLLIGACQFDPDSCPKPIENKTIQGESIHVNGKYYLSIKKKSLWKGKYLKKGNCTCC